MVADCPRVKFVGHPTELAGLPRLVALAGVQAVEPQRVGVRALRR